LLAVAEGGGWASYQLQWRQLEPVGLFLWPKPQAKSSSKHIKDLTGPKSGREMVLPGPQGNLPQKKCQKWQQTFFHPLKLQISSFDCKWGCIFLSSGSWIWIPIAIRLDNHSGTHSLHKAGVIKSREFPQSETINAGCVTNFAKRL